MTPTSTRAPIARHTLSNGLRVCVVPDDSMPLVAVNVTYDVGSAHEEPTMKGFAHLFEHLMFAGSQNVAAGELSAVLGRAGGQPNAFTDFDVTSYHVAVPTGALETALWLEADRMGGMLAALDQTTLDNERAIVKNERRQTMETVPFGLLFQELFQTLFPAGHPYHWLPMGSMEHLDAADLDVVRGFFSDHYGPNSAVLTLAGDITAEDGFALAERYFGGIPRNTRIPERASGAIGPLESEVRVEMDDPMPVGAVVAGYRIPRVGTPEWAALDLGCRILAAGEASRLGSRLLLEEGLAQEVSADVLGLIGDVDAATVGIWLSEGADRDRCEAIRDEEIAKLSTAEVEAEELERALAGAERAFYSRIDTRGGQAEWICRHELAFPGGDPFTDHLEALRAVTPADIREAFATWMRPDARAVILYSAAEGEDAEMMFAGEAPDGAFPEAGDPAGAAETDNEMNEVAFHG